MMDSPVLAITPGEPSGIGPECAVRMVHDHPELRVLLVGDLGLLRSTADQAGLNVRFRRWTPDSAVEAGIPSCADIPLARPARPGHLDTENAAYVLRCLRNAVKLVRAGHAGALVTGPVHKGVINEAGVLFSGHTEYLASLCGTPRVVMMLAADQLRVALVTTHLPLRDVPDAITRDAVRETIRITHDELKLRFGIDRPRIQVLGLNPHAGEGGHLGSEDASVIAPAISSCVEQGIDARGPVPADSAFTARALADCDCVIAMYHDQGLPVLKHAGFGRSVNISLGLPIIRTSVDHGTALDIAGKGVADAGSLYQAARAAADMCRDIPA